MDEARLSFQADGRVRVQQRGEATVHPNGFATFEGVTDVLNRDDLTLDLSVTVRPVDGAGDDDGIDGVRVELGDYHITVPGEDRRTGLAYHVNLECVLSWEDAAKLSGFLAFALTCREKTP